MSTDSAPRGPRPSPGAARGHHGLRLPGPELPARRARSCRTGRASRRSTGAYIPYGQDPARPAAEPALLPGSGRPCPPSGASSPPSSTCSRTRAGASPAGCRATSAAVTAPPPRRPDRPAAREGGRAVRV
ncbi:hypothetical protein L209DRAFT_753949 [Thermothelomyces heterothallicus CBS 203.75]